MLFLPYLKAPELLFRGSFSFDEHVVLAGLSKKIWIVALTLAAGVQAQDLYTNALTVGSHYENRKEYLEKVLKPNKVQFASAWAKDSISKYVTFYRDEHVLASLVADGKAHLRNVTVEDLKTVPITGLLFANVQLHGRGMLGERKVSDRYTDGKAHLVLKIGDEYIQPVKEGFFPSPPKTGCTSTLYLWSAFGNYQFSVGSIVPITFSCDPTGPSKFSLEFAFQLTPEQMKQKAEVFLVDGNGKKHHTDVDLSKLL